MNKKIIAIIGFVLFGLVVFIISLFGKIPYVPPTKIYCSEVKFNHEKAIENNAFKIILTTDIRTFQLEWTVGPENAENKGVKFFFDETTVTVSETGLVTFKTGVWGAIIKIRTIDGSDKEDTINLWSDIPGEGGEVDP